MLSLFESGVIIYELNNDGVINLPMYLTEYH